VEFFSVQILLINGHYAHCIILSKMVSSGLKVMANMSSFQVHQQEVTYPVPTTKEARISAAKGFDKCISRVVGRRTSG
jgi:hypothetical protein